MDAAIPLPGPATSIAPCCDPPLPLVDGGAIFAEERRLLDLGGDADLEMYEFSHPTLIADLVGVQRGGARVRVILDPSEAASAATGPRLLAAGVEVRWFPVDSSRHQIDHVKLLLAGSRAVVGGMNWGAHSPANHDFAVEMGGGDALALARIFAADWSLAGGEPRSWSSTPGAGSVTLATTSPAGAISELLLAEIGSAQTTIDAEVYVLTDGDVRAALVAAASRGVRVRVILDPGQDPDGGAAALLLAGGIEARHLQVDEATGQKLHAKLGLFDRRSLVVGSANWTHLGLHVNHELDVGCRCPAPTAAFEAAFEYDWPNSI